MSRRLPPLNQLRAFEAAARHLSFKDAAEELSVTHAAVSHQVKALEEYLGTQLFQRMTRGVKLTGEAEALSGELKEALDRMDAAVRRFTSSDMTGTLQISVVPWYGTRTILPNLPEFHSAHPGLQIELAFSYETVDFANSDFDAALRHGRGDWPDLLCEHVHRDFVSPLGAPDLVADKELPLSPDEVAGLDLAVGRGQEDAWRAWLEEAGLAGDAQLGFVEFDNRALATEFALGGNGLCLPDIFAMELELRTGQLVQVHPLAIPLESGLHMVCPETPFPDPRIEAFSGWLKELFDTVA